MFDTATDYRQQAIVSIDQDVINLPDNVFRAWISNPEPDVRLAGLFLSVYSTAVTKPVTGGILRSIRQNLVHLHTETDANFRKELLNHTQRLLDRIKGSTVAHIKAETRKNGLELGRMSFTKRLSSGRHVLSITPTGSLIEPLEFLLWYVQFIEWELRPTASYQRRATALRTLSVVLKSGLDPRVPHHQLSKSAQGQLRWAHSLPIINQRLIRLLLDLVFDAFDDIRANAASLLKLCLDSLDGAEKDEALRALPRFIRRGEAMMLRTGRADQADGVARAYSLMFSQCLQVSDETKQSDPWSKSAVFGGLVGQLEETLKVARENLSLAVDRRPVHGLFAALQ